MKKIVFAILLMVAISACNNEADKGKFTLNATLKNIPDEEVYLEEIFFSDKAPEVLDTAVIKNGKFSLSAKAAEQGFYRIRFQNEKTGYIFINDKPEITFIADAKDTTLTGPTFSSPANASLKLFLIGMDEKRKKYITASKKIEDALEVNNSDSIKQAGAVELSGMDKDFKSMVISTLDTVSSPVMAEFLLGYTREMDTSIVNKTLISLEKRFPEHKGINNLISQYRTVMKPAPAAASSSSNNKKAPDFTMNDTEGKPFTLSSLRGKYVLVDFWASWCAPCRGENPNVVAAYNKYKNKNFTILGVSLDDDKTAWLEAIKKDKLTWKHVSDLKGWENATVSMYGYQGIPYNVLLNPSGEIIATELRGPQLQAKLAEVLK